MQETSGTKRGCVPCLIRLIVDHAIMVASLGHYAGKLPVRHKTMVNQSTNQSFRRWALVNRIPIQSVLSIGDDTELLLFVGRSRNSQL